jgi:hypothetical protein
MFMNRFFDLIQKVILRQILVVFIAGVMFFGFQTINYGSTMLVAQADTVKTPEGIYYKGMPDQGAIRNDQQVNNAQSRLRETANNVREKLNLDEEVPESTKEFLDSTKSRVGEAVEPITGSQRGYYQDNPPEARRQREDLEARTGTARGYSQDNISESRRLRDKT